MESAERKFWERSEDTIYLNTQMIVIPLFVFRPPLIVLFQALYPDTDNIRFVLEGIAVIDEEVAYEGAKR